MLRMGPNKPAACTDTICMIEQAVQKNNEPEMGLQTDVAASEVVSETGHQEEL